MEIPLLLRNGRGDIIGLIDNTGTKVVSYVYDSWGKLISIKDANGIDVTNNVNHVGYKNPYRYRGYRYDSETGWYYLNSRYYNPEWGRYLNADGLIGELGNLLGHNMFSYCKNNHVNTKHPSGCWPTWSNIMNAGKKLVNSIVKAVKETIVKISFVATTIVIFAAKNPDIAQAIILPAASRGLKRT